MTGCSIVYHRSRQNLPLIKEEFKTENNLIKGCQSKCGCRASKILTVVFTADSDAILTKGIIAILIRVSLIKVN
jgi:cysteine desulfuration protein SufE